MFRALFGNALISTAAFFIVGLIGLLLVPVLLAAYGLGGLGLIMLARLFLPGAGLGLFDFGVSEIATQTVATARVDGNWPQAHRRLTALTLLTLAMATAVALPVLLLAPAITAAFSVPLAERFSFALVLESTAALLPLLFIALLAEGCLKGFENFRALRVAEVVSTVLFAGSAVVASQAGLGFEWIVWLHLGSQLLRAAMVVLALARASGQALPLRGDLDSDARSYVLQRGKVFFTSRLLGTAQHQSPAVLIGLIVGPAGVGLYDTLARLPRFAKSVLGILNTTLLPYATRLDAAGDDGRLRLLNLFGFTLLPALVFPPLAAVAALSAPILHVWIGDNYTVHAVWMAIFWALPGMNTVVSFQNYVLMSRLDYVRASNWMSAAQVLLQTAISLLLVSRFAQFSFILGYIGAAAMLFGWQLRLARREIKTPAAQLVRLLVFSLVLVGLVAGVHATGWAGQVQSLPTLVACLTLATAALLALTCLLFLGRHERAQLMQLVGMLRRRGR
jgi:O-antigen/teichoic acid export membrane protein